MKHCGRAMPASLVKTGDAILDDKGYWRKVIVVRSVVPECLAQTYIEWEGGYGTFCNYKNIFVRTKE